MTTNATIPPRVDAYLNALAREPGNAPLLMQREEDMLEGARHIAGRKGLQLRGPNGRWMHYRRAVAAWAALRA